MTPISSISTTDVLDAFQVDAAEPVRAFLREHSFVEPLLGEIAAQLPKYFPNAPVRLQAEVERDATGQLFTQLVVEIVVEGWSVDAAMDAMDAFVAEWWLHQWNRAGHRVIVTSAFG
jgi:hypothetical protein